MSVGASCPHHNSLVNSDQSYNPYPTLSGIVSNQMKTVIPDQTEGSACDSKSFLG